MRKITSLEIETEPVPSIEQSKQSLVDFILRPRRIKEDTTIVISRSYKAPADGQANWCCVTVIKDSRNAERIRVACRDEAELRRIKEAAQKTAPSDARVLRDQLLRDQLYPVKVNNANRAAILDHEGHVLPGAAEVLGKENEVSIAKIAWLSRKDQGKAYGSMVVYVTKGSEAVRLL
jgi:hypothetical protein